MRYSYNALDEEILIFDTSSDNFNTLKTYFYKYLTKEEIENLQRYKEERDKIIHVISYSIPKITLAKKLNISPIEIEIVRKENERPYYKDYTNYFYSISHSGSFLGFVLSKNNVGLDIEQREKRSLNALKYVASEEEINECQNFDDKYELWTFKEAYSKLIGKGISKDLINIKNDNKTVKSQTLFINHLVITLVKF